jgi:hypothetical protein
MLVMALSSKFCNAAITSPVSREEYPVIASLEILPTSGSDAISSNAGRPNSRTMPSTPPSLTIAGRCLHARYIVSPSSQRQEERRLLGWSDANNAPVAETEKLRSDRSSINPMLANALSSF